MTGYADNPEMQRRVERVARMLVKHPDHGLTRLRLARRCSTPRVNIAPTWITSYWSQIDKQIVALSGGTLYGIRPIAQTGYKCAAVTDPQIAMLGQVQREKNLVTRMQRDTGLGSTLLQIAESDVSAALIVARRQGYLDAHERQVVDLLTMEQAILENIVALPSIP